jgi:hypothetical protein
LPPLWESRELAPAGRAELAPDKHSTKTGARGKPRCARAAASCRTPRAPARTVVYALVEQQEAGAGPAVSDDMNRCGSAANSVSQLREQKWYFDPS